VHGDTTTTFSAALASFYAKIPVGHVEAGLRSGNIYSPYPEEMNRRLTSNIATLHFAPTEGNRDNLINSGISRESIYITGNTVIDALQMVIDGNHSFCLPLLNQLDYKKRKIILLTAHRRENWGLIMQEIFIAVRDILQRNPDIELIFPVHLNPVIKELANRILGSSDRIYLIPPLDYVPFVNLMARSYLVLTDSGGIQEEAPALGKPVLVLRTETERPEAVEAGTVKVVGVKKDQIIEQTQLLLDDKAEYNRMAQAINPYGDGHASQRIIEVLDNWLKN
jgi:UDP-N-acetylglucosamine 2-epimerase (non-hydrolysing)